MTGWRQAEWMARKPSGKLKKGRQLHWVSTYGLEHEDHRRILSRVSGTSGDSDSKKLTKVSRPFGGQNRIVESLVLPGNES